MHRLTAMILAACSYAPVGAAYAVDERAALILNKCAQSIEQIHSLQVAFSHRTVTDPGTDGERSYVSSALYTYAHGKIRSEVQATDRLTGEKLRFVGAFDGQRYQLYMDKDGSLILSNSPTVPSISMTLTPMEWSFVFLSKVGFVTFPQLRDRTTWDDAVQRATYLGTEAVGDFQCERIEVSCPVPAGNKTAFGDPLRKLSWLVYFAPQLSHFPIKCMMSVNDDDIVGIVELRAHEIILYEGVELVIPTSVWSTQYSVDTKARVTSTEELSVDVTSLKVNEEFDSDLFIIPATTAEWIHDVDTKRLKRVGGKSASIAEDTRGSWRGVAVFVLMVALVVSVIAWIWWKR